MGSFHVFCVLANWHIGSLVNCPVCTFDAEDLRHMLFRCPRSLEIWEGLGLLEVIRSASRMDTSGSMILEELLCSPTPGGVTCDMDHLPELVMITCWYLWWSRRQIKNQYLHQRDQSLIFLVSWLTV
jgi:hypothetical protein